MALKLIDRIITQLDKDEIPINVYLDLSKSFDTIDHIILLDKLDIMVYMEQILTYSASTQKS